MKLSHTVRAEFDDPNLVSVAGLAPVLRLAQQAGLGQELAARLTVGSPNAAAKASTVIAGMLAGADSIDDLNVLRHGAMPRLFDEVRAPSTVGTFLRQCTFGHAQQIDAAGVSVLARLAELIPDLVPGSDGHTLTFLDIDDTLHPVYGYHKQAAAFGRVKGVRALNVAVAALSGNGHPPILARGQLRRGSAASITGAERLLTQSVTVARCIGVRAPIMVRADGGYYAAKFVAAAIRAGITYSITARMDPAVTAAITAIPDHAWTPISYPKAIYDPDQQRWISDAEVAETPFTAFTSRGPAQDCRLVVRRVKRLQPTTSGAQQTELFTAHRYHAFITNSTLPTTDADTCHRDHAVIEQVIAELKDGPLAHLPSGDYGANCAWLSSAIIAFNLARAAATAAGMPRTRWATIRTRLINIPARLATTSRRLHLHLPKHWPWATQWLQLHTAATGPPQPATT